MSLKQVIVMRKDLNMRKGKMIAQGAHASLGAYFDAVKIPYDVNHTNTTIWLTAHNQTKICVSVDSESELLQVFNAAKEIGLPCYLVTDMGKTEFNGMATHTCVAIGPAQAEEIDKITGALPLL